MSRFPHFFDGALLLILLAACQSAQAADCPAGNKLSWFSKKTCTVGGLEFTFADYSKNSNKDVITVTPTADKKGLRFDYEVQSSQPTLVEDAGPPAIEIAIAISFRVKGIKKGITHAGLAGNIIPVGKGSASGKLILGPPKGPPKVQEVLELQAFTAVSVEYAKPVPAGNIVEATNDFVTHSGKGPPQTDNVGEVEPEKKTLTFTDTFLLQK